MRASLLFLFALAATPASWNLFTCIATTKDYVVGAKLLPSGLFRRTGPSDWKLLGYNHPFVFAVDYAPRDPSIVYVAAGNGLIRIDTRKNASTILTAEDVTELRDVHVDPTGRIYFAYVAGIRTSSDDGKTWQEISGNLARKYTECIRADRKKSDVLIAGTEDGLWRSDNAGGFWERAGAAGFQIMRLEQSPHDPCFWLAGTQSGGVFASKDCGRTFENWTRVGVGRNVYDIAFDPTNPKRIAVAGWGIGITLTENGGDAWVQRDRPLPTSDVWSIAFDPVQSGRLFASVHEQAVYRSDDAGLTWTREGLEGSIVNRMKFIPEVAQ